MPIGGLIFERVFETKPVMSLYFSEPADQTMAIEIMHDLRSRAMRDIRRTLSRDVKAGTKPVLIIDCRLRFESDLNCREFHEFMRRDRDLRFSHYIWQSDHAANQELFTTLVRRIGRRNAYVDSPGKCRATECYYPVKQGERLAVVHFAV